MRTGYKKPKGAGDAFKISLCEGCELRWEKDVLLERRAKGLPHNQGWMEHRWEYVIVSVILFLTGLFVKYSNLMECIGCPDWLYLIFLALALISIIFEENIRLALVEIF